jgi:Fe2+ transport system protein B
MFYVADGTRRDTFDQIFDLREHARSAAGDVPSIVALNKVDLKEQWLLTPADTAKLITAGFHVLTTSAKSGEGVEAAFLQIATSTMTPSITQPVQPPVRHGN